MSDDQEQEQGQAQPAVLPQADGPLVRVRLHDGQELYAVVKSRLRETDRSWWYRLQVHLPSGTQVRGRLIDDPTPIDFLAPATRCQPIQGQPYDQVPTQRAGITPAWKIEERVYFTDDVGPSRIVHRGGCHASRDLARPATTDQARTILERDDAAPCDVCRPDRPLHTAA